jgi:hypothetical protein
MYQVQEKLNLYNKTQAKQKLQARRKTKENLLDRYQSNACY